MRDTTRGKRAGKRGSDFRPSKGFADLENFSNQQHKISTAALVAESGKYFECAEVEETPEDHIIPRRSLTQKQYLRIFPQRLETEPLKRTKRLQMDKSGKLVETTDTKARVIWKSDKTLLRQGKPDQMPAGYTRVTSHSKRRQFIPEGPAVVDVEIETDLDVKLL